MGQEFTRILDLPPEYGSGMKRSKPSIHSFLVLHYYLWGLWSVHNNARKIILSTSIKKMLMRFRQDSTIGIFLSERQILNGSI